jgi:hypothetical protein
MIHDEWRHRAHAADDLLSDIAAVCWGDMPAEPREGGSEAHRAAWVAVCALRADAEQLLAEVSYLRASVPPKHPSDYGHEVWAAALREAEERGRLAALEEAAVLLDELASTPVKLRASLGYAAHRLRERGEHRREEKP